MYRVIDDFMNDWKYETGATLKVLNALTDASLKQQVAPGGRTLGDLAWHLVLTLGEMGRRAGVAVEAPGEDAAPPVRSEEIISAYGRAAESVGGQVRAHWSDASLLEKIDMYGDLWSRGATLASVIRHQAHHRAQMTVLMRQAGLRVPGVYGPSREEWAQMGLPPHR